MLSVKMWINSSSSPRFMFINWRSHLSVFTVLFSNYRFIVLKSVHKQYYVSPYKTNHQPLRNSEKCCSQEVLQWSFTSKNLKKYSWETILRKTGEMSKAATLGQSKRQQTARIKMCIQASEKLWESSSRRLLPDFTAFHNTSSSMPSKLH